MHLWLFWWTAQSNNATSEPTFLPGNPTTLDVSSTNLVTGPKINLPHIADKQSSKQKSHAKHLQIRSLTFPNTKRKKALNHQARATNTSETTSTVSRYVFGRLIQILFWHVVLKEILLELWCWVEFIKDTLFTWPDLNDRNWIPTNTGSLKPFFQKQRGLNPFIGW